MPFYVVLLILHLVAFTLHVNLISMAELHSFANSRVNRCRLSMRVSTVITYCGTTFLTFACDVFVD